MSGDGDRDGGKSLNETLGWCISGDNREGPLHECGCRQRGRREIVFPLRQKPGHQLKVSMERRGWRWTRGEGMPSRRAGEGQSGARQDSAALQASPGSQAHLWLTT